MDAELLCREPGLPAARYIVAFCVMAVELVILFLAGVGVGYLIWH